MKRCSSCSGFIPSSSSDDLCSACGVLAEALGGSGPRRPIGATGSTSAAWGADRGEEYPPDPNMERLARDGGLRALTRGAPTAADFLDEVAEFEEGTEVHRVVGRLVAIRRERRRDDLVRWTTIDVATGERRVGEHHVLDAERAAFRIWARP